MEACARSLVAGAHAGAILAEGREIIGRAGVRLDYLELRDALTQSQQFLNGYPPLLRDRGHRNETGNRFPTARDRHLLPALHLIDERTQAVLCIKQADHVHVRPQ